MKGAGEMKERVARDGSDKEVGEEWPVNELMVHENEKRTEEER
jgi:hypothetical protein